MDKKFECPNQSCGYTTNNQKNFKAHLQIHKPHSLSCPQPSCSYTTNLESYLRNHERVHHSKGEKRYKCSFCPYTSHHSGNLVSHVRKHTKETPFKCPETGCDFRTTVGSHLKQHEKSHSGLNPVFKCPFCTHTPTNKNNLRVHVTSLHGEDLSMMASEPCKICPFLIDSVSCPHLIETPFQCPNKRCKFRSRTEEKLNGHQLTHSKENNFECPHSACEFRTRYKNHLKNHIKLHEENPEKFYQCPLCPYKSRLKSYVSIHLRTGIHDGVERQRKFKCPESGCNYSAFQKSGLTLHLEIHNPEKSLRCPEVGCSYRTNQKVLLKSHVKVHSDERPWKCNLCEKTFRYSKNLKIHIRNHTQEILFQCPETGCEFRTNYKLGLTVHLRGVHWKVRPFKCPMCNYSATSKTGWKGHQRQVHGRVVQKDILGCTVSGCGVIAKTEKELAIHFTSGHNLPHVLISRVDLYICLNFYRA